MHPKDQITADLKEAMKAGEKERRDTLRMLSAAFKQVEIDERKELSEDDAIKILKKEAKRREEEIAELENAGRDADNERAELALIESYLPEQMGEAEIEKLAQAAIDEVGATSPKEMGQVMKVLMPQIGSRADGKTVNQIVGKLLKS